MKHHLINLLTALSLLLCTVTALLWLRSYSSYDFCSAARWEVGGTYDTSHVYSVFSANGGLRFQVQSDPEAKANFSLMRQQSWHQSGPEEDRFHLYPFFGTWSVKRASHQNVLQRAGFDWDSSSEGTPPETIGGIIAPYWSIALMLMVLPIRQLRAAIFKTKKAPADRLVPAISP